MLLILVCSRCQEKTNLHGTCRYVSGTNTIGASSQQPDYTAISQPLPYSPTIAFPVPDLNISVDVDPDPQDILDDANQVGFDSKVQTAIDSRLGLPVARDRSPIPMTDAPLFGGTLSLENMHRDGNADNVLPPRKQADHLASLYWQHLDPLEPLLDKNHFYQSYQLLFDGNELDCDQRVFVCTLNAIFALSTQVQEFIPAEQRTEASRTFFHRGWSLLRPQNTLWEAGSTETVQCLLLLARYLQGTRNLQTTWMVVGVAVRMAQGLGLHLPHASPGPPFHDNQKIARQVWQCCVSIDR